MAACGHDQTVVSTLCCGCSSLESESWEQCNDSASEGPWHVRVKQAELR